MTKQKPVRLTFTGVDERTDLDQVMRLGRLHPHVEFAVLVGSRSGQTPARTDTRTCASSATSDASLLTKACGAPYTCADATAAPS